MATKLEKYAEWLVANQSKKGTQEFETVAKAYRLLRDKQSVAPKQSGGNEAGAGDTDGMDIARAAMQGILFGFGDEAEGLFKGLYDAATEGKSFSEAYTDARDNARKQIAQFREDDPLAAYGTEIVASLPTALLGGAGLARAGVAAGKGLGAAVGRGGIEGAVYGLGGGEGDVDEQIGSAAVGGAGGAVLAGATSGALRLLGAGEPSDAAKMLLKGDESLPKSVRKEMPKVGLTLGQQQPNTLLGRIENFGLSSTPFIGPGVKSAQREAVPEFSRMAVGEALAEIGKAKALKTAAPEKAIEVGRRELSDELERLLPDLQADKLMATRDVQELFDTAKSALAPESVSEIERFLTNVQSYANNIAGNKIDGRTFQTIDSTFSKKIRETSNNEVRNFLRSARKLVGESLDGKTPTAKADYLKYKRGYAKFKTAQKAAGKTGEIFTPSQLRQAARSNSDITSFSEGRAFMQPLAKAGEEVLRPIQDSGTAIRTASMGPVDIGKGLLMTTVGEAYRPLSRGAAFALPKIRSLGLEPLTPASGSLLGNELLR